jgi:hypothetical protein
MKLPLIEISDLMPVNRFIVSFQDSVADDLSYSKALSNEVICVGAISQERSRFGVPLIPSTSSIIFLDDINSNVANGVQRLFDRDSFQITVSLLSSNYEAQLRNHVLAGCRISAINYSRLDYRLCPPEIITETTSHKKSLSHLAVIEIVFDYSSLAINVIGK